MLYRQDLPGFGEPMDGQWDGYQRINTDTKEGGIIGIFRQGSKEGIRNVTVNYLSPGKIYQVKSMDGKTIVQATGEILASKGFSVMLKESYSGVLYEVSAIIK